MEKQNKNTKSFLTRSALAFALCITLTGCFNYNKAAYKETSAPPKPEYCEYEVLINVKGEDATKAYLEARPHQVLLTTSLSKWWIWPWPPTIPYFHPDLRADICRTGADAVEVYQGFGMPNFRFAHIRLLKYDR
ncbi:MAG: hypothetical protein ACOX2O_10295 [Bdellovibrionota bacterium]|jgi:hypothetical protein